MVYFFCLLALLIGLGSLLSAMVFAWLFRSRSGFQFREDERPAVAVVMCVRGCDPFLQDTIVALGRQSYSDYQVIVVVDHRQDPAWSVLESLQQALDPTSEWLEIQELQDHCGSRGLKCSALLQAIRSLPQPVVVTIDSDAIPHADWLQRMVQPLQDKQVGAVTSNQWFEPDSWNLGTWVRSVWHAGAVVPTAVLGNPWAGAFAMRRQDMIDGGLLEAWEQSVIDDGPVRQTLHRLKKRLVFVPANFSINREDCSLAFAFRYVGRMLTWSRLYESTFWITLIHMLTVVGTHVVVLVGTLWYGGELLQGTGTVPEVIPWLLCLVWLVVSQVVGYFLIRAAVLSHREKPLSAVPATTYRVGWVLVALPLALLAYAWGSLLALFTREICWRQIRYCLKSGGRVTMQSYHPYVVSDEVADRTSI